MREPRHDFDVRIRAGRAGAIVADDQTPALQTLDDESASYYGGRYFVCESVSGTAADRIVLCWEFCRGMTSQELRSRLGMNLLTAGGLDA